MLADSCAWVWGSWWEQLRVPRVGPDVPLPTMTNGGIVGWEGRPAAQAGLGVALAMPLSGAEPEHQPSGRQQHGGAGLPCFRKPFLLHREAERFPETHAARSLPLPLFLFHLVHSVSLGVSLFHTWIIGRHLERVITITRERLGLLNWIYWGVYFFLPSRIP